MTGEEEMSLLSASVFLREDEQGQQLRTGGLRTVGAGSVR